MMGGSRYFVALVMFLVALKFLLATVTPYGYDFVLYLSAVLADDWTISWSPWIILVRGIFYFWLWLPIHQNDILPLRAAMLASKPSFLMSTHYLLTMLVKTPLILADLATGFLVYKLGTNLSGSQKTGRRAALLWLANPFGTFFVEMWGTIDIIIIMLSLVSIVYLLKNRTRLSALALLSAVAIRLSPILTWLSMMSWLVGRKNDRRKTLLMVLSGPLGLAAYLYWSSQAQFFSNFVSFMSSTGLFSNYTPVTLPFSEYTSSELYQLYSTPGFAVIAVVAYYLIAQELFRKNDWTLIAMTLSGILLVYGFADWFPTAFLWAMPLLAIFNSKEGEYNYSAVLYGILTIYLITFYSLQLASSGVHVLFIPVNLVPFGRILTSGIAFANVLRQLSGLDFQTRSVLAGVSIAYSISITWKILMKRRK
jgi:hypothetical protein